MHGSGVNSQEHADPTNITILHAEGKVSFFDVTPCNGHHQNWMQALNVVQQALFRDG